MAKSDSVEARETQHLQGEEARDRVRALLKDFRAAMMVTESGGELHVRPMGILGQADEFDGTLWFFTERDSAKVEESKGGRPVSLIFQNDGTSSYLHLAGMAEEDPNREKMKELYTPLLKTWFPKGLEDPRLTMLRFQAVRGSFWDSPAGMLQVLAAFTKSMVTGSPGKGGESGELRQL